MRIGEAIAGRDWGVLTDLARLYFGASTTAEHLSHVCLPMIPALGRRSSKDAPPLILRDGDLLPWLKNRLIEAGAFPAGGLGPETGHITAVLHVGFLFIDETPDQLEMLRRPEPDEPERVARSKVFSTPLHPVPIDRVARRVAPPG